METSNNQEKIVETSFSEEILENMKKLKIDPYLTLQRLNALNSGKFDNIVDVEAKAVPEIDGKTVVLINEDQEYVFDYDSAKQNLKKFKLDIDDFGVKKQDKVLFNNEQMQKLGLALTPFIAYGILNGGSASSYIDETKNKKMFESLFDIYKEYFNKIKPIALGKAKAITPAFINPDKTFGEDFFLLKLRALLIKSFEYKLKFNKDSDLKVFQMDSYSNSQNLKEALNNYKQNDLLNSLIKVTGNNITDVYSKSQPLLSVFTTEKPHKIFSNAYGKENSLVPMPAGHGHNFFVLKDIYKKLKSQGKKFAYLGNIDNLANTLNDSAIAFLALSGKPAGFEFSIKTDLDKKGGIAVIDQNNKITCADMGAAISREKVSELESQGKKILFNIAFGLFDLDYLCDNLDNIIENLPMRRAIQNNDKGKYLQLEQVTWEVIGMIDNPAIFAVDKFDRFIAAKTFTETLITSALEIDNPDYPKKFKEIAEKLNACLTKKLTNDYGMKLVNNKWIPKSIEELKQEILNH